MRIKSWILWIPAILVLAGASLCPFEVSAESANSLARQGNQFYKQERYQEAADAYRQALEKEPTSAHILYNLGTTLAKNKNPDQALQILEQTAKTPATGIQRDAYYNLGYTLTESADAEEENPDPAASPAGAPQPHSFQQQFDRQLHMGQLERALSSFREALVLDPNDNDARYNYETILKRIEELKEEESEEQDGKDQKNQSGDEKNKGEGGGDQSDSPQNEQSQDQDEQEGEGQNKNQDQDQEQQSDSQNESQQDDQKNEDQQNESESESEQEQKQDKQDEGLENNQQPADQPNKPQPPQNVSESTGQTEESQSEEELTPEQMDALRLLNLLEQEKPEQFKRLFQFRVRNPDPAEKDW